MIPYKTQNLVYEWVDFSKITQICAKIGSNLRKFEYNSMILLKIWHKIGPIGISMGHFFLKIDICMTTFKFWSGTSLPKSNLSTPPGLDLRCHVGSPIITPTHNRTIFSFICWKHYATELLWIPCKVTNILMAMAKICMF